MFFLTLLLSSILTGTDTLTVKDTTPVKTIDLTGTVIVNADYANQPVLSINKSDVSAVDTLDTADEFVKILLYGDRTWRYIKVGGDKQKPEVFDTHWETTSVNPYQKPVDQLADALKHQHSLYAFPGRADRVRSHSHQRTQISNNQIGIHLLSFLISS